MNRKAVSRLFSVLGFVLLMVVSDRAVGDVTMVSRTATKMPRGVSEEGLETIVYLKGAWIRRESHGGAGVLAGMLKDKTTIVNRVTGERLTLFAEARQYHVDTSESVSCGLEEMVDLSWLGVNRGRLSASLSLPDTAMTACGCELRPVQIELSPRGLTYAGRTTLRLWMCSDYDRVFGKSYRQDLFCGNAPDDSTSLDRMSKSWQVQLGLSDADANEVRTRVRGVPFVMESRSIRDTVVLTSTTITMTEIKLDPLPDSLFAPPAGYELGNPGDSGAEGNLPKGGN